MICLYWGEQISVSGALLWHIHMEQGFRCLEVMSLFLLCQVPYSREGRTLYFINQKQKPFKVTSWFFSTLKSCHIQKNLDFLKFRKKDWGQEEKGTTENEMVGWHHRLNEHGFGWTPGVGVGQGGLACCSSWGRKESDTTEWLNWLTDLQNAYVEILILMGWYLKVRL